MEVMSSMSKGKAHKTNVDMSTWAPGVEHWSVGGGVYYAVMVDNKMDTFLTPYLEEIEKFTDINFGTHQILARPTTLVRCDANGVAIDADTSTPAIELITEYSFDPGTSAKQALALAGYEVV